MSNNGDARKRAYDVGAQAARARIDKEAPHLAEALRAVCGSDIVVVDGCYDHVHLVLDSMQMPFVRVPAEALGRVALRPEQLLIVNCPGQIERDAVGRIRQFVDDGGSLFSTDWALRHVIEPCFPGTVDYNGTPTRDDVVRIEVTAHDNPFLRGVMDPSDDPQWWLEGSSYPIRVLDAGVQVLVRSSELGSRYGEPAVAVRFEHGRGEVFHMISHYYLQRTELRTERHAQSSAGWFEEKGVPMPAGAADLCVGDVESASSSVRLVANLVGEKKSRTLKGSDKS
ncbi:MAG TPA: hypothetical protein VNE62_02615 [Actinomycetota bacterium]|nr:hypothetical protein [Actinomycetota bacterium]